MVKKKIPTYRTKAVISGYKAKLYIKAMVTTQTLSHGKKYHVESTQTAYFFPTTDKVLLLRNAFLRCLFAHFARFDIPKFTGNLISYNFVIKDYRYKYMRPDKNITFKKVRRYKKDYIAIRDKGRFKGFVKYEQSSYSDNDLNTAGRDINVNEDLR